MNKTNMNVIEAKLAVQESRNDQMWGWVSDNIDDILRINKEGPSEQDKVLIRKALGVLHHTYHLKQFKICLEEKRIENGTTETNRSS